MITGKHKAMATKASTNSWINDPSLSMRKSRATSSILTSFGSGLFALTAMLFLGCRLWYLDFSLWNDEVFGIWAARLSWSGLVNHIVAHDVHPPLFYLLLKGWILMSGESLFWLRLFPVVTAMASLVPFYFLCRELKLEVVEINLTLALMAVNQYLVDWSQNLRMYSLLLFFTLCSLWLFLKLTRSTSNHKHVLIGLSMVNVCLIYTHYFGWLIIMTESVYVLFLPAHLRRYFIVSVACVTLCFIPWAYAVVNVAITHGGLTNLGIFARPGWKGLVQHFGTLNGAFYLNARLAPMPTFIGMVLFTFPILLWARRLLLRTNAGNDDPLTFRFLCLFAFLPPVLVWVISEVSPRSFWAQRNQIISAVPYMILVAAAVNRQGSRWIRHTTIVALVTWAAAAGFKEMNKEKVSFESLVHQMMQVEPQSSVNIPVYALAGTAEHPIQYYIESARDGRFTVEQKQVASLDGKRFWVAFQESPWQEKPVRQELETYLVNKDYRVGRGFESGPTGKKAFLFPVWSEREVMENRTPS